MKLPRRKFLHLAAGAAALPKTQTLQAAWCYFGEAAHTAAGNKEAQPKRRRNR
jgi:hypothetical protein